MGFATGVIGDSSIGLQATEYIDVSVYSSIKYSRCNFRYASAGGIAFYDADGAYVSGVAGVQSTGAYSYDDDEVTVPTNAAYVRMTGLGSNASGFYVNGVPKILSAFGSETDVSNLRSATKEVSNVNYKNVMTLLSGQRNMFDYTSAGCTQYQYIGADGTIHTGSSSAFANYWTSHPITVGKGTYKFTAYPSEFGSSAGIVGVFDLDGNMTGTLAGTVENGVATLAVDRVCRVCFNSHKSIIAQAVFCEASLWDGTYHPYDMAISGNVLDLNVGKDDTNFFLRTQGTNLLDLRGGIAGKYFNVAPNQRYTGMLSSLNGVSAYYVRLNGAGNYITKVDRGNFGSNAKYLSLYDKNKRYLTTVTGNLDTSGASHASECTFEITAAHISAGAVYLGLTVHDGQVGNVMVVKSTTYPASFIPYAEKWTIPDITVEASQLGDMTGEIGKDETDFFSEERSDNLLNIIDPEEDKYFSVSDGALTAISSSYNVESVYVKLDGAGTYTTKADYDLYGSNAAKVCLFNSGKTYVTTVTGTLGSTSDGKGTPLSFEVTDAHIAAGAVYAGLTLYKPYAGTLMFVKGNEYPGTYEPYRDEWTIPALTLKGGQAPAYTPNPLYGKKAAFDGDSICASSTDTSGKGAYAGRIAAANSMGYANYAVGGGTITAGIDGHYCISGNVDTIYAAHPDADYIIFEGGTNDADLIGKIVDVNNQPVTPPADFGTWSTADFSGNYDDTTFCGAVETLLYKALSYWPHAKIGYVCGPKMAVNAAFNASFFNRQAYWKTATEICKKWGVPYLNLCEAWHANPLMTMYYDPQMTAAENREAGHFYGDGQHPTPAGYDDMSPIIEEWMRTL